MAVDKTIYAITNSISKSVILALDYKFKEFLGGKSHLYQFCNVPCAGNLNLSEPKSAKAGTSPLVENVGHFFLVVQQVASSSKIKFNHLRRQLRLAIVLFLSKEILSC